MAGRDDMVISPTLAGQERDKASQRAGPDRRPSLAGKRGGGFRRVVASRLIKRARAARARVSLSRLATRAAAAKAAAVAILAAIILKRQTGMTFEQMGQVGADVFFGEKAMQARASSMASATLLGNMNMRAFQRESERARRTGTVNRAAADTLDVHAQLTQQNMERERGDRAFLFDDRFRVDSIKDVIADRVAYWGEMWSRGFADWTKRR